MNAPAHIKAHNALRYCPTCTAMSEMASDGTCLECLSIIDLTLWQETEEAWASDARAMECAEPEDPFFAPSRALERGYL